MARPKIVTHPGKGHRDDYLACCLLLFHLYQDGPASIERRSVLGDDLACTDTWVIDTGKQFQPHFKNFDHHQKSPDVRDKCALDLVCDHLFDKEDMELARSTFPWFRVSSVHDCHGSVVAAKVLGMTGFQYTMCSSPIEKWVLETFSQQSLIEVTSATYTMMLDTGRSLFRVISNLREQKDTIDRIPGPNDHNSRLRYWDVRGNDMNGSAESQMMLNHRAKNMGVDVVINYSTRSDGPSLYVLPDSTGDINLSLLENYSEVYFSHKNGHFLILHKNVPKERILELLEIAMVKPMITSHTTPKTRPQGRPKNKRNKNK